MQKIHKKQVKFFFQRKSRGHYKRPFCGHCYPTNSKSTILCKRRVVTYNNQKHPYYHLSKCHFTLESWHTFLCFYLVGLEKFCKVCISSVLLVNHESKCFFTNFAIALHIPYESFKPYGCWQCFGSQVCKWKSLKLLRISHKKYKKDHLLLSSFQFEMAPHTGSATPEQIETLLNFLDDHRELARGRLRSVEGKVQAKRLWDELCRTLNSMGGCTKTNQQWQKVWYLINSFFVLLWLFSWLPIVVYQWRLRYNGPEKCLIVTNVKRTIQCAFLSVPNFHFTYAFVFCRYGLIKNI